MFASKAIGLAEVFKGTVGKTRLEGSVSYSVELSAPEGDSTGGGMQAMQHISLVPDGGGPTVVIGMANQATRRAELRSYTIVAESYRKRFKGSGFPAQQPKYDDLLRKLRVFFEQENLQITLVDSPPVAAHATPAPAAVGGTPAPVPVRTQGRSAKLGSSSGSSRRKLILAVVALLLVAGAAAVVLLLRG